MTQLSGKIAIITGAGGGIGAATAELFAKRGARVLLADINREAAERVAARIKQSGGETVVMQVDIAHEDQIVAMIAEALRVYGKLDVLHNNAADLAPDLYPRDRDVEHMDAEVWDRTFRVNVRGTMLCCKHALPHMARARAGSIINMASSLALHGSLIQAAYSSSKAAIIQMTRAIAASHGKYGIRCNSVCPGLTLTEGVKNTIPAPVRAIVESETLLPTLGGPEDLAALVAFLASDDARNITGANLVSDGGLVSAGGIGQMRALMAGGS